MGNRASMSIRRHGRSVAIVGLMMAAAGAALAAEEARPGESLRIEARELEDLKSVYATVRSTDRIEARVRTPGTVASLMVDEGSEVETGQVIAIVADQKLALRLKALDAQIKGLQAEIDNAKKEVARGEELLKRGVTPKARLDEQRTELEVLQNRLKSADAERSVVTKQVEEGEVLAPAKGRVLAVPVTPGSVVMPGESVATIAANEYVLRLELPERHARALKKDAPVTVGARGLGDGLGLAQGKISQVYPELSSGRVIADAMVPDLGDYFVGERVLVWISAGRRRAIAVPRSFVFTRHGNDFVRVKGASGTPADVVVQVGREVENDAGQQIVEVLAGLRSGDEIVRP